MIDYVITYTYHAFLLHEYLHSNVTLKLVATNATRGLGLLIARCKLIGVVPYVDFIKLYIRLDSH